MMILLIFIINLFVCMIIIKRCCIYDVMLVYIVMLLNILKLYEDKRN